MKVQPCGMVPAEQSLAGVVPVQVYERDHAQQTCVIATPLIVRVLGPGSVHTSTGSVHR